MERIKSCTIRDFKSIVNQQIDLGWINVFVGANGSGKSNVLEALGVLSAAVSGRVDNDTLKSRGVRLGVPRLYKSSFKQRRTSPHIFFEAKATGFKYSVSLNNPLDSPNPSWYYKTEELDGIDIDRISRGPAMRDFKNLNPAQGLVAYSRIKIPIESNEHKLLEALQNYCIYTPNTAVLRGLVSDEIPRDPLGLSGGNLADALYKLLAQLYQSKEDEELMSDFEDIKGLLEWVDGFDVTFSAGSLMSSAVTRQQKVIRFTDRYMKSEEQRNQITAYDASEGALYVLFCAILVLLESGPSFFAIDNFDSCLNPRLLRQLISILSRIILRNKNKQVILTIHNPLALDGLPLKNDKVRLFAVNRNSKGYTIVNRVVISDEILKEMKENDWPLSRMWVMGHIGGIGNV